MEYVVVGAGALGQSFAGLLARGGQSVTLLATPRSEERLRASGAIRLRGAVDVAVKVGGSGVQLTTAASNLPDDAVLVFTTKGQDLPAAIDSVRSAADQRVAWAAGVQNGLVKDDLLGDAFGAERVVGAVTILGAQRQPDNSVQVGSLGATYLGELDGRTSERVMQAADALQAAGIPTHASEDIHSVLWSKACNATGVFGVTVLARASNNQLFANPHLMRAYLALVRETAAIARAYSVQVGDHAGFPPIRTYAERDEQATIDQIRPNPDPGARSYASMTSDLLAGSPLEVDAVFGDIVERAERKGVPAPCLRLVRDVIRGIDPGHAAG
ncbi:MAG: 2-dehydropantoate 2-reductase [Chloroflexota bacterium]|nr:2-dehydropantoate 2-reductase [Chloroflexota bacterium]